LLTHSAFLHIGLCCLQINVLSHWLVTSILQCIPLHRTMSGYEWHSDSVLISDKPPFKQHWIDTSTHNPFTVFMNCLMFKTVTDVYIYMYSYKSEYRCLWSKEINVEEFPVLPVITHYEYHFCFWNMFFM